MKWTGDNGRSLDRDLIRRLHTARPFAVNHSYGISVTADGQVDCSWCKWNKTVGSEMKHILDLDVRPVIKLCEIENMIKKYRIVTPAYSRQKLIRMCEAGIFETVIE